MSNDARSLGAVLVVCGMIGLVCLAVPLGVGAIVFLRLQRSSEQALAAERQALVAEQQARMQAEMARMEAQMQARQLQEGLSRPAPAAPRPPAAPKPLTLDERKLLYTQLKLVRDQLAALESAGSDDPAFQSIAAQGKAQIAAAMDQIAAATGLTRQQLDEIVAEGDREKW